MPVLDSVESVEKELARCNLIYKSLDATSPFISAVHRVMNDYFQDRSTTTPVPPPAEIAARIRSGRSVVTEPAVETKQFVGLLDQIADEILAANAELDDTVKSFRDETARFLSASPAEIGVKDVLGFQRRLTREGSLENDLASFVLGSAFSAFVRHDLSALIDSVPTDLWEGGACPTCGTKPHFGLLRREDNAKILECWLCRTRFEHTRIKCPFCDNEDQAHMGFFTVEGSDACRVNFCRACSRYYKIFDLREFDADDGVNLTIHNLATLSYDVLARHEGFSPGSELEWVNTSELDNLEQEVG